MRLGSGSKARTNALNHGNLSDTQSAAWLKIPSRREQLGDRPATIRDRYRTVTRIEIP